MLTTNWQTSAREIKSRSDQDGTDDRRPKRKADRVVPRGDGEFCQWTCERPRHANANEGEPGNRRVG